jgi:hypothetical protein
MVLGDTKELHPTQSFFLYLGNTMNNCRTATAKKSIFTGGAGKLLKLGKKVKFLTTVLSSLDKIAGGLKRSYKSEESPELATLRSEKTSVLPFKTGIGIATNYGNALSVLIEYMVVTLGTEVSDKTLVKFNQKAADCAANLETFADNNDSEEPMPKAFFALFKSFRDTLSLATQIGVIPDTLNLTAVVAILGKEANTLLGFEVGYGGEFSSKRPILSLPVLKQVAVRNALLSVGIEVRTSEVSSAIKSTIEAFPDIHLKATVEAAAIFYNSYVPFVKDYYEDDSDDSNHSKILSDIEVFEASNPDICKKHLEVMDTFRDLYSSLAGTQGTDDPDVIAASKEFRAGNFEDITVSLQELDQFDGELLMFYDFLLGASKWGFFERHYNILKKATQLLENPSKGQELVDKWLEEGQTAEIINLAYEAATNGGEFKSQMKDGKEIVNKPDSIWKSLAPLRVHLNRIGANYKDAAGKWQPLLETRIKLNPDDKDDLLGISLGSWATVRFAGAFDIAVPDDVREETEFFTLTNSVIGDVTITDDGSIEYGESFMSGQSSISGYLGPKGTGSISGDVEIKVKPFVADPDNEEHTEDTHRYKTKKRLSLWGTSFFRAARLSQAKLKLLPDLWMRKAAHEGRLLVNSGTFLDDEGEPLLTEGIYSSTRGLRIIEALIKGVLEVNDDIPLGYLYYTQGSTKDKELEVIRESAYLMIGYKHHPEGAKTSFCNLSQPGLIVDALEDYRVNAYGQAARKVASRNKHVRGDFPCAGLASKVARQAIGNADNIASAHMSMEFEGTVKSYVRGRVSFDKSLRGSVAFKAQGAICIVDPFVYERIADICGGADSDDVYYVRRVEGGWEFSRDPNIGIEKVFYNIETGEVS